MHPGVPDDRFQAALAGRLFASTLVPGRRVLDAAPVLGACAVLAASGPQQLVAVEPDFRRRRWLRRYEPPGVEVLDALPATSDDTKGGGDSETGKSSADPGSDACPDPGAFDLVLDRVTSQKSRDAEPTTLHEHIAQAADLLAPRGVLLLWDGDSSYPERPRPGWNEDVEERLHDAFVTVERFFLVAPPGLEPDWHCRLPARARANEYRIVPAERAAPRDAELVGRIWLARNPRRHLPSGDLRLHVGCGDEALDGWINLDILPFPAVDVVIDVVEQGLPFSEAQAVYAEHFLEHLEVDAALRFLAAAHGALCERGVLRLSTPSLDWTWRTLYRPRDQELADATARGDGARAELRRQACAEAIAINRSFYGWKHKFLWNRALLERALRAVGFDELVWPARGESRHEFLRGIERHEESEDAPDRPHVLVVEGRKSAPDEQALNELVEQLERDFLTPVRYLG